MIQFRPMSYASRPKLGMLLDLNYDTIEIRVKIVATMLGMLLDLNYDTILLALNC